MADTPEEARARAAAWYRVNPERGKANARKSALSDPARRRQSARTHQLKQYGLTHETFNVLRDAQGNRCAICGRTPHEAHSGDKALAVLVVDHCHRTNKVRGLLCLHCNHGLGSFKDNPSACHNAASYLERHAA